MKFEDINKQIKIVDVIEKYISLIKKGKNHWCVCPFHSDTKPSMSVSEEKNIFKCFSCNVSGNAIAFVMKYEKLDFKNATKKICNLLNIEYKFNDFKNKDAIIKNEIYRLNKLIADTANKFLLSGQDKEPLNYLKDKRKLDFELIKEYNIGFCPDKNVFSSIIEKWNQINPNEQISIAAIEKSQLFNEKWFFFSSRILFPIWDENKNIIGFTSRTTNPKENIKYLNSRETLVFKKSEVLYNIQNIEKNKPIYLFEGILDLINAKKCEIKNSVCSLGVSLTNQGILKIKKINNELFFCFDNDNAGIESAIKNAKKLISEGLKIKIVDLFDLKIKDIDELISTDIKLAREKLLNPINFFKWYIKKIKKNNSNISLQQAHDCMNELIGLLFFNKNQNLIFNKLIDLDYAKNSIKEIFNIFEGFDGQEIKEKINESQKKYIEIIETQIFNTEKIRDEVKTLNSEKKENENLFIKRFFSLIEEWIDSYEWIQKNFEIEDWKVKWDLLSDIDLEKKEFVELIDQIIFSDLEHSEKIETLINKYKKYKNQEYEVQGPAEFFKLYFLFNKELQNEKLNKIKQNKLLNFQEKVKTKEEIESLIKKTEEKSKNIFKKIILLRKKDN